MTAEVIRILFLFAPMVWCMVAPMVFLVLCVVVVATRARAAHQRLKRCQALAQRLGLTLDGAYEAYGTRNGIGLRVQWTYESRGSGKSQRSVSVTRYRAFHDPPLRMGLEISEQTPMFGKLLDLAGLSNDVRLHDPALDDALRVRALEPQHAKALLAHPGVGPAILTACRCGHFELNDHEAVLQHDGWADDGRLAECLDALHAVSRAISTARASVRASWEPALDQAWGGITRIEPLAYDAVRSRLSGRFEWCSIAVSIETVRGMLRTYAVAQLAAPLGIGLQVYKTGFAQNVGKLFGAQDVQVGVPEFDAYFTVKAASAEAARAVLGSGAAAALARLIAPHREIRADDERVEIHSAGVVDDAREIALLVRSLAEVARSLGRGGGQAAAGVYR
jgi:hypothetical protein